MQFKKTICLFLAFFLLVSNIGFAFNVHFCGDEIASISVNTEFYSTNPEEDCCGVIEQKSQCCNDKIVHVQNKSDNGLLKTFAFQFECITSSIEEKTEPVFVVTHFKNNSKINYYCEANAPPLFKLYSQFIFYDKI